MWPSSGTQQCCSVVYMSPHAIMQSPAARTLHSCSNSPTQILLSLPHSAQSLPLSCNQTSRSTLKPNSSVSQLHSSRSNLIITCSIEFLSYNTNYLHICTRPLFVAPARTLRVGCTAKREGMAVIAPDARTATCVY